MPQDKINQTDYNSEEFKNLVIKPLFAEPESKRKFVNEDHLRNVDSPKLPNGINLSKLSKLLMYSDRYEISIQFWPKQTAVYISKDDVDLNDFGGDFDYAVNSSIEYLDRINKK